MGTIDSSGVELYYEEAGTGIPIVFVHEFAGDLRSWEPQVRFFSRRFRCITYNARGYPPSDVPSDAQAYSQKIVVDDIANVVRGLNLGKAHIVGCSMGAFATLHFGIEYPQLARSLTIVGAGYGSDLSMRDQFLADTGGLADRLDAHGMPAGIHNYNASPARLTLARKDPRGYAEFCKNFAEHSALGSALTLRGYQMQRPTIYQVGERMRAITAPTLIVTGDEDTQCLEPGLYMKHHIPKAGLWVLPWGGHAINLEDPDVFNRGLLDFLTQVDMPR